MSIPSRETARRAVRALDPYQVELVWNGEAVARKKFRPVLSGITVTRPLERQRHDADAKQRHVRDLLTDAEKLSLGLYIKGDEPEDGNKKRKKAARWTLTAATCCATRCIVGMVLSRNPGAEAAVQLLQMITTNKGAWWDAVGWDITEHRNYCLVLR